MERTTRRALTRMALVPAVLALLVALPASPSAGGTARPVGPAALAAPPRPAATLDVAPARTAGASHRVVAGETLSHIAARHGVSVSALAAANGLSDPDVVIAGTTIVVPTAAPSGAAATGGGSGLPSRLQQSPVRQSYVPLFDQWAAANGIPADLLKAMTWLESGWQNGLVSPTGAVGIGQLMPDTVEFMELLIGRDLDPTVVDDNIRMSARYLRWLLARYGAAETALAAYYQGPASVERQGLLAETEVYVANVLALRDRF